MRRKAEGVKKEVLTESVPMFVEDFGFESELVVELQLPEVAGSEA